MHSAARILVALALSPVVLAHSIPHTPPTPSAKPVAVATPDTAGLARIEVVFVLDTTGSMSGLIEAAKQKVWHIASSIATAQPRPEVLMGLVGYRDRGDDYVTRLTPLTEDLDHVYSELMSFSANGGGDEPESVNQALSEAVTKFEWRGRSQPGGGPVLRIIFLVGDAPPHMDYADDVKYTEACRDAAGKGIIINAIQCGASSDTQRVWQDIARRAEGRYFQIEQSGGVVAVATPFDADLANLSRELEATLIDYGDRTILADQAAKRVMQATVASTAAPAAAADRAVYNISAAGAANLLGRQELVQDVADGRADLANIPADNLPEHMRTMSIAERQAFVAQKSAERAAVRTRIQTLDGKRSKFIQDALAAAPSRDGFDDAVVNALAAQAAAKGIRLGKKAE